MTVLFFSALFQIVRNPQTLSEVMATTGTLFEIFIYHLQCSFLAVTDKKISGSAHSVFLTQLLNSNKAKMVKTFL